MSTKTDATMSWEAVANHVDALGLKLKVHFENAAGQLEEVNEAFEGLGSAVEAIFSAIGAAVRDPAVREDAGNLAASLVDALADTLSNAGRELEGAADGLRCHRAAGQGRLPKELSENN